MKRHEATKLPIPGTEVADRAPPVVAPEAPKVERKVRSMEGQRFRGMEFMRNSHLCTVFADTTPQDLCEPPYWAHVSTQVKSRDRIEAWADDGTWMAEYVVLEAGRNWAKLHLLAVHHFTTADQAMTLADQTSPYEITHKGPHGKWSVIRKSDRELMSDGHETAGGAASWVTERMKADR